MPHSNSFCYEFEQYRFDPAQRLLTRDGQSVPLTPKATDVLLILLRHAGQLVEKEKLINEVWPDTFVEEANVTQNIFILRRALEDKGSGPKYIETVARRGYRFVANVRKVQAKTAASEAEERELIASSVTSVGLSPILAVMPFTTTGETEFQYLAEGIPESIINSFSGLSQLRVISRSTAFRYKNKELDAQTIGQRFGADAVLVGKICAREKAFSISVELVDVATGWQLWGDTFAGERENIFEIQDQITKQVSRALRLPLTHDDEKRVAKRYTENATAYQAYLEGRYHWSKYTRVGIENAISHFGRAIDLDPNYALAYAGIVDCYLRLATNYLPPEDALVMEKHTEAGTEHEEIIEGDEQHAADTSSPGEVQEKVKLRHEWDWKGAERELRRANELKTDYPAAHQWHAAYRFSISIYRDSSGTTEPIPIIQPRHIPSLDLTPSEDVQVLCTVAREQMEAGNYEAGCLVLQKWWTVEEWPKLDGLTPYSAADLLFTAGTLADCLASTGQLARGHKHSEALLNGSLALCELLSLKVRAAEVRIELGACYYRQGFFEVARNSLELALQGLLKEHRDLRSLCLFRLAVVDRHSGRLGDSLTRFRETSVIAENSGPWIRGRYHQELGTTLRDLAIAEQRPEFFKNAIDSFQRALYEFEAVGNHRYVAAVENNLGFVLLAVGKLNETEQHLFEARRLFASFGDYVRCGQVDETLAQLYLAQGRAELADLVISKAIASLESVDEEALLAEALITQGRVFVSLNRRGEAKAAFDGAHRVADRCGHQECAGLALLIMLEELDDQLLHDEKLVMTGKMRRLLVDSQQVSIRTRVKSYLHRCESTLPHHNRG